MAYQRIKRGAPATVSVYFEDQNGELRDVAGVSLVITRADGSVVVSETNLESNSETQEVSTQLSPAQTADLDILSLVATADDGSVATSTVDVVGGFLFSLREARQQEPSLANKDSELLLRVRDQVESEAERYCNRAFTERLSQITLPITDLVDADRLVNDRIAWRPFVIDGTTYGEPTGFYSLAYAHDVDSPFGWAGYNAWSTQEVTLYVEHGINRIPPDFKRDAIARMKDIISSSSASYDARATSMSNDQGTFSLVTAGIKGARTSSPDWNAALEDMRFDVGSVMSVPIR